MKTFSALLALCAGNSPVTGDFPSQRPVKRRYDIFYDLYLNRQLSKQLKRRWFETLSRSLWRHCNWSDVSSDTVINMKSDPPIKISKAHTTEYINLSMDMFAVFISVIIASLQFSSKIASLFLRIHTRILTTKNIWKKKEKEWNSILTKLFADTAHRWPGNLHHISWLYPRLKSRIHAYAVKPVCNDHLWNKICYSWFIQ